mmetsp:Transcript_49402/g.73648  ORF Transcript_49402/g.73648 Transcript_49402/m.73648 type:complete len:98 (+) Transcript_49402:425-718(+)
MRQWILERRLASVTRNTARLPRGGSKRPRKDGVKSDGGKAVVIVSSKAAAKGVSFAMQACFVTNASSTATLAGGMSSVRGDRQQLSGGELTSIRDTE